MFEKLKRAIMDNNVSTIAAGVIVGVAVLNFVTFVVTDVMNRLLDSAVEQVSGNDFEGYLTQIVLAVALLLVAGYWFNQRVKK